MVNQTTPLAALTSIQHGLTQYFLARDSIYAIARYMPSSVRPSVRLCPSVCHTGGSVKDGYS